MSTERDETLTKMTAALWGQDMTGDARKAAVKLRAGMERLGLTILDARLLYSYESEDVTIHVCLKEHR